MRDLHAFSLVIIVSFFASSFTPARAAAPAVFPVVAKGRHLVDQTGAPFMIVGDAPQAIINVPLTGPASLDMYFSNRQMHGINSLWVNLICDSYTACPNDATTYDGIAPFTDMLNGKSCPDAGAPTCYDLTTPNPAYFARMDAVLGKAARYGLLIFLDPISTDGCRDANWMQTLRNNGIARAATYGTYLGNRYKTVPNIVWQNGNDFQCWRTTSDENLAAAVATGIQSAGDTHIQTAELDSNVSTTKDDTGPLGALATLNAVYTYFPAYDEMLHAYNQMAIPAYLVESDYELENLGFEPGVVNPLQVLRKQHYWSMLSGATGVIYGNHYTWTFAQGWPNFLDTPGAAHLTYMRDLFVSLQWYNLVPDQSHAVMTDGYGTYAACGSVTASSYATTASASSAGGTLVVAYIPTVRAVTISMTALGSNIRAQWYDPTSGTYTMVAGSPFANTGPRTFTPPGNNAAGESDWVLLLKGHPLEQ
jgi:hypothetical protein